MTDIPVFETERLILRAPTEADAPSWTKNFVDYEVIGHLTGRVPWPYPEGGILDFLKTQVLPKQGKNKWVWGLFLKDNPDDLIGVVDLWRECNPANRGFWLGRKFWGQGLMTEAVEPVMDYAFDELGFEKLVFSNALGNERSRRVKEKTGARFLRTEPGKYVNPEYTEKEVWELTKAEWEKFKNVSATEQTYHPREGGDPARRRKATFICAADAAGQTPACAGVVIQGEGAS